MGHNKAYCRFNETILMNATIMENDLMYCDSPSLMGKYGYKSHGANIIYNPSLSSQFSYSSLGNEEIRFYNIEISITGGDVFYGPA